MANPSFDYRGLSIPERLQLVEDIWDSIAEDADSASLPVPDDHKAVLDKRLADADADPAGGSGWDEVKARLYDRLR